MLPDYKYTTTDVFDSVTTHIAREFEWYDILDVPNPSKELFLRLASDPTMPFRQHEKAKYAMEHIRIVSKALKPTVKDFSMAVERITSHETSRKRKMCEDDCDHKQLKVFVPEH